VIPEVKQVIVKRTVYLRNVQVPFVCFEYIIAKLRNKHLDEGSYRQPF
jgi:hypothetical protein